MVRQQLFIRKDQQERLKAVADQRGVPVAELVRAGIDLVLTQEEPADDGSWRDAIRNIEGMWKDRDDLDAFYAEKRRRRAERRKRMNALMSKAQEGVGGAVVAEVAYRNEYISARGQAKNAEEAWVVNKCRETPGGQAAAPAAAPGVDKPTTNMPTMRGGRVVY